MNINLVSLHSDDTWRVLFGQYPNFVSGALLDFKEVRTYVPCRSERMRGLCCGLRKRNSPGLGVTPGGIMDAVM